MLPRARQAQPETPFCPFLPMAGEREAEPCAELGPVPRHLPQLWLQQPAQRLPFPAPNEEPVRPEIRGIGTLKALPGMMLYGSAWQ